MAKATNEVVKFTPEVPVTTILDALRNELKGLKEITESNYKTEGKVTGFPNLIKNETSTETLIKMWSSLSGREAAYNAAQAEMAKQEPGFGSAPVFTENGFSVESVKSDILLRYRVITHTARKQELEALVSKAEQFLTEKDKYAMFVADLKKAFGK